VPLPQPRMRKEPRFLEVVDQVYAILAGQTEPEHVDRPGGGLSRTGAWKGQSENRGSGQDDFGLLIYALYPTTGEQFLKWKYGLEEKPASVKPKTLDDIRKEEEAMAAALERPCKNILSHSALHSYFLDTIIELA